MTESTLCHHCHKPLVDGACPDPIVVRSIREQNGQLAREAIGMKVAWEDVKAENGRLLERYHRANNYAAELEAENERMRQEIAGVRSVAALNETHAAESANKLDAWRVENERLRAALERIIGITNGRVRMFQDIRRIAESALGRPNSH